MNWERATLIDSKELTPRIKSLTFTIENYQPHRAGQFYEISVDGGQTSRCYSLASAPEKTDGLEFGIELIDGGQVSTPLHKLVVGDTVYVNGPQGLEMFTWEYQQAGDLVLIGGGSGMVPLMAMLQHHIAHREFTPRTVVVIACAPTLEDLPYHDELATAAEDCNIIYYPVHPGSIYSSRLSDENITAWLQPARINNGHCYICGSIQFTNSISEIIATIPMTNLTLHREYFG